MLVLGFGVKEFRIHFEGSLEVKGADVDEFIRVNDAVLGPGDGSEGVDGLDTGLNLSQPVLVNKVNFVEHDAVGEGQLFDGFVLNALGFFFVQMLNDVFRINNGDDAVEVVALSHPLVDEERLCDRGRIGQAGGFDENAVEILDAVVHVVKGLGQIATNRTTDAAVHDLNDGLFRTLNENVFVNAHLTKFIFDHSELLFVIHAGKNVVQQGGFS